MIHERTKRKTLAARAACLWVGAAVFQPSSSSRRHFSPLSSQIVRSVHVGFLMLMVLRCIQPLENSTRMRARATRRLGARHRRLRPRLLPLGVRGRSDPARWRPERQRSGGRHSPRGAGVRGRPPHDGLALADHLRRFSAYGLFGQYLPGALTHRGYEFNQIVDQMFLGTEGIYGMPIYVSSTYIFLFILFGAFLEQRRHDQPVQ